MSIEKAFVGNHRDIKKTVVISPVFYPTKFELKGEKTVVGNIIAHDKLFSYIKTYPGSSWVFDTVLCLKKTKVKDIIFIGTAGSISSKYKIGDVVVVKDEDVIARQNRSNLKGKIPRFVRNDKKTGLTLSSIMSCNSLLDETRENLKKFKKQSYDIIDLETSSFHKACKTINKTGFVFLVIQDEPLTKPFYKPLSLKDADRLQDGIEKLIRACRILIKSL